MTQPKKQKPTKIERARQVYLKAHYSGEESRDFWRIVNSLPDKEQHAAYSLGVALQNLEAQVLKHLHDFGGPGLVAPLYWFNGKVNP